MNQRPSVLEFLETTKELPRKITINRTINSKYLFYLVVRHYRKKTGRRPQFYTYQRIEANTVKATMEEHSIFGENSLYVLEGFSSAFVGNLNPTKEGYLVAETEDGELTTHNFNYRERRSILKVLLVQMGLKLSLRELLKLDWTDCRDYPDFEILLRRAKLMEWDEDGLGKSLRGEGKRESVLALLKRNQLKDLLGLIQRYGPTWFLNHLTEMVTQLAHYKALKTLGYAEDRAAREMEIGWSRVQELEEAGKMVTREDLLTLANRLIKLDSLTMKNKRLGAEILITNSKIGVGRN